MQNKQYCFYILSFLFFLPVLELLFLLIKW